VVYFSKALMGSSGGVQHCPPVTGAGGNPVPRSSTGAAGSDSCRLWLQGAKPGDSLTAQPAAQLEAAREQVQQYAEAADAAALTAHYAVTQAAQQVDDVLCCAVLSTDLQGSYTCSERMADGCSSMGSVRNGCCSICTTHQSHMILFAWRVAWHDPAAMFSWHCVCAHGGILTDALLRLCPSTGVHLLCCQNSCS
jgi:hypothetical protein